AEPYLEDLDVAPPLAAQEPDDLGARSLVRARAECDDQLLLVDRQVDRSPGDLLRVEADRLRYRERAGLVVGGDAHIEKDGIEPFLQEVYDLSRVDSIPVAPPLVACPDAPGGEAQQAYHAGDRPRPRKGSGRRVGALVLGLPHRALHDDEARQQSIRFTELRERDRVPLVEQGRDARRPHRIEAAL